MSDASKAKGEAAKRNRWTMASVVATVLGMLGMAYASVPLYRIFCQATGFGGTPQVGTVAPGATGERMITVRFDANTAPELPWSFRPGERAVALKVGENGLTAYKAKNLTAAAITGHSTFNVVPEKAGQYFVKVACFCFEDQTLKGGESVDMPVSFYIDPAILKDRSMDDVTTITLSYTFFRTKDAERPAVAAANRS